MSSEVLVKVEGISKKFCRSLKKSLWYGVQDICSDLNPFAGKADGFQLSQFPISDLPEGLRRDEFWAVNNVSFELRRGECLGLIGRNGAGKTTLLKVLNGLIKPDSGCITMRGRVAALIALGAGFNPILSGRENIYVNGSVLGLTKKEIDGKMEEIIDFTEIGEFIDTPVQNYSSGMQVRLGFAIATALEPDVLILDEVLAVGDASFRHKCYHRINKLLNKAAVIFVSHSMDYVAQVSSSVMMMRRGVGQWYANSIEGIHAYAKQNEPADLGADGGRVEAFYPPFRTVEVRLPKTIVPYGAALAVEVEIESEEDINDLLLSFTATNESEQPVMSWSTGRGGRNISLRRGRQLVRFVITPLLLHPGRYTWDFHALRRGSIEHCIWFMRAGQFVVEADFGPCGIPYLPIVHDCDIIAFPSVLEAAVSH